MASRVGIFLFMEDEDGGFTAVGSWNPNRCRSDNKRIDPREMLKDNQLNFAPPRWPSLKTDSRTEDFFVYACRKGPAPPLVALN